MLSEEKKYEHEFANIMNGLAESVFEMSDEEIEKEIAEDGDTEDIRRVLLDAVKACKQKNLVKARESYQKSLHLYRTTSFEIPDKAEDKRSMIQTMIGSLLSQNQTALTLQFRDYQNLPDEDLDDVLKQLIALNNTNEPEK